MEGDSHDSTSFIIFDTLFNNNLCTFEDKTMVETIFMIIYGYIGIQLLILMAIILIIRLLK